MTEPRTLIIGLDGATFDLIDPWIARGHLPTLARALREGARGALRAFPNMNSASAWTSIVTGCNSGAHGIYDFGGERTVYDPGWRPTTALDRLRPPFWQVLSATGQRVGVVNVPISYPSDLVNGFMISGMDAPGTSSAGFAHPEGLLPDLRRAGIDYVLDVSHLDRARRHDPTLLPTKVREMVDARARAASLLMHHHQPDVMMVVFTATDRMQHAFWGRGPVEDDHRTWQPLAALYRQLDTWIGRLWDQAGPDASVIIISDHGFGPAHRFRSMVNPLFAQLGWLSYRADSPGRSNISLSAMRARVQALRDTALKWVLVTGRRCLPGGMQYSLAMRFPDWRQQALHARNFPDIDWTQTRVYAHVTGGGILVRPADTDLPQDDGANSRAYETLCAEVRATLLELRDPAAGQFLVKNVWRRDDLYQGPHIGRAPDMQIEWNEEVGPHRAEAGPGRNASDTGDGTPRGPGAAQASLQTPAVTSRVGRSDSWKGRHRSRGIFIACGPNIRRGVDLSGGNPLRAAVTHYDLVPTLYHLRRLPIPDDLDGRVLTELFEPAHLERNPVKRVPSTPVMERPEAPALDEKEARQVEQRLRDLGYL